MRLICPNCAAQYEVPDQVIPDGGRDVQCSNCGHTWFQSHPDDDPNLAEELDQPLPQEDWTPEPEPESTLEPHPAPEAPPAPQPRGLDPDVAEVLREEAQRETLKRAAEADRLESQPDLGLAEPDEDGAARRQRESRERMARMRGEVPTESMPAATAAAAAATAATNSRRDLLPNVDEINQTLRASSERREVETPQGRAPVDEEPSGGFRRGFSYMVVLVILAIAVYLMAGEIAGWVPALGPLLESYVAWVDGLRVWLDGQVAALLSSMDSMSSEANAPTDAPANPETDAPETN